MTDALNMTSMLLGYRHCFVPNFRSSLTWQ